MTALRLIFQAIRDAQLKAILAISAHWATRIPTVSISQATSIQDFLGFPRELYQMNYSALGHRN